VPAWVTWEVPDCLSSTFHNTQAREAFKEWVSSCPFYFKTRLQPRQVLDSIALAIGLSLSNILAAGQAEPDSVLHGSPYQITDQEWVLDSCKDMTQALKDSKPNNPVRLKLIPHASPNHIIVPEH
jgi:hypothetical protein